MIYVPVHQQLVRSRLHIVNAAKEELSLVVRSFKHGIISYIESSFAEEERGVVRARLVGRPQGGCAQGWLASGSHGLACLRCSEQALPAQSGVLPWLIGSPDRRSICSRRSLGGRSARACILWMSR